MARGIVGRVRGLLSGAVPDVGPAPVRNFPAAQRRVRAAVAAGARELDLGGLGLTTEDLEALLPEMAALADLETLHLGYAPDVRHKSYYELDDADQERRNAVRALPAALLIAHPRLQHLDLSGNRLTALPPEIGRLAALERLLLDRNRLTALPSEIGGLASVRHLSLTGNCLMALPPQIGHLSALERLDLAGNRLTALPPEIGDLSALHTLWLARNGLTALPPEIGGLSALHTLWLAGNRLTALPPEIARLAALQHLGLAGNPLPAPYFDAVEKGLPDLLAHITPPTRAQ